MRIGIVPTFAYCSTNKFEVMKKLFLLTALLFTCVSLSLAKDWYVSASR